MALPFLYLPTSLLRRRAGRSIERRSHDPSFQSFNPHPSTQVGRPPGPPALAVTHLADLRSSRPLPAAPTPPLPSPHSVRAHAVSNRGPVCRSMVGKWLSGCEGVGRWLGQMLSAMRWMDSAIDIGLDPSIDPPRHGQHIRMRLNQWMGRSGDRSMDGWMDGSIYRSVGRWVESWELGRSIN